MVCAGNSCRLREVEGKKLVDRFGQFESSRPWIDMLVESAQNRSTSHNSRIRNFDPPRTRGKAKAQKDHSCLIVFDHIPGQLSISLAKNSNSCLYRPPASGACAHVGIMTSRCSALGTVRSSLRTLAFGNYSHVYSLSRTGTAVSSFL